MVAQHISKMHTEALVKWYKCDEKFAGKTLLKQHQNAEHRSSCNYKNELQQCDACDMFLFKLELIKHRERMHEIKWWKNIEEEKKKRVISDDESVDDDSNDINLNENKNNDALANQIRKVKKVDVDDCTINRTKSRTSDWNNKDKLDMSVTCKYKYVQ